MKSALHVAQREAPPRYVLPREAATEEEQAVDDPVWWHCGSAFGGLCTPLATCCSKNSGAQATAVC